MLAHHEFFVPILALCAAGYVGIAAWARHTVRQAQRACGLGPCACSTDCGCGTNCQCGSECECV